MSMTEEAFDDLVRRIRNHLGCTKDLATEYARGMGESPEIQNNEILVRNDERRIIARIPARVLEGG
jgi:hypothetical protein